MTLNLDLSVRIYLIFSLQPCSVEAGPSIRRKFDFGKVTQAMFIIGNFLKAVAVVLNYGLTLFMWVVIARAILSWVNPDPYNPIVRFIYNVTEPVLQPIRSRIPFAIGIDISPIVVILGVIFLQTFLVESLMRLSANLL